MPYTTEKKIQFNVGEKSQIVRVNKEISLDKRTVEVTVVTKTIKNKEDLLEIDEVFERRFPIIQGSKLSPNDPCMMHEPVTKNQTKLKNALQELMKTRLYDFRVACMDPSLDWRGNIFFEIGNKPAVKHYTTWWEKKLKEFMPQKDSRMGTINERNIFLGVLIKTLVEEQGYSINDAWAAVCDDSCELGHYSNSENAQKDELEPTGSRKVGKFSDLANVYKIVKNSQNNGYMFTGGAFNFKSFDAPLMARFETANGYNLDFCDTSVGWLVMDV